MKSEPPTSDCPNCGTRLEGRFCHACGQKSMTPLGLHNFLHEATHEFLHLDGKILNTVKLLIARPWQLTRDYVEGRRVRHLSPIRIYLTVSVLFFFIFAVSPGQENIIKMSRDNQALTGESYDQALEKVLHNTPIVFFILIPVFALLTRIFYTKTQPYYVAHLYYSIHWHTLIFAVLSVVMLLEMIPDVGRVLGFAAFVTLVPYHFLSLRGFFRESWGRTALKGLLIGAVHMSAIVAAIVTVMIFVLTRSPG